MRQRQRGQKVGVESTPRRLGQPELAIYLVATGILQVAYVLGAAVYRESNFGFNQLRHLGAFATLAAVVAIWPIALLMGWGAARLPRTKAYGGRGFRTILLALLIALACTWAFHAFATRYVNRDGLTLMAKIPKGVTEHGAYLTHDEMLELYAHSRLYRYANQHFGWSVGKCYQVASAMSGGVFVFIMVLMAGATAPESQKGFLGLTLSGGYVQLFFGDIENYSLVTTAILLYLGMAYLYVRNRMPLWAPSLALSLALGFHLLAGWLLPSLAYLFLRERRRGEGRQMVAGAAALALPMAALLSFFHFHGLPIQRLFDSSHVSGMGGDYTRAFAPLDLRYHWGIINIVILLVPSIVVLPALVYFKRLGADPYSRFLQVAAFSMLVFAFVWRTQLTIFEDWNLFAPGMVPVALLVSRSLSGLGASRGKTVLVSALALTAALHTYVWVMDNHFSVP